MIGIPMRRRLNLVTNMTLGEQWAGKPKAILASKKYCFFVVFI
jgi:hypothetical protein